MGYSDAVASSGLRLSLGPWLHPDDLANLPDVLDRARRAVAQG
jgi:cysteine desulfurase